MPSTHTPQSVRAGKQPALEDGQGSTAEQFSGRSSNFGFRFVAPLALGSTLNPINSTMISTALVPIANDFHASVAETGWLIAGLYLASAVAQPTMGRLADLFGALRGKHVNPSSWPRWNGWPGSITIG